jgi:hypothetical protein
MAFLVVIQFIFEAMIAGVVSADGPGRWYAEEAAPLSSSLILFGIFMYFFILDFFTTDVQLSKLTNSSVVARLKRSDNLLYLGILSVALAVVHFISRDPALLRENYVYLLLMSPEGARPGFPLAELIGSATALFTFFVFSLMALAISARKWSAVLLLGISCAWFLTYAIICCSRTGAAAVAVFCGLCCLMNDRHRLIVAAAGGCGFIYLSMIALDGRGVGAFGWANLARILVPNGDVSVPDVLVNAAQGTFVTTDGFLAPGEFREPYKLLSLSPFPSLIDHFDQIRVEGEIRLAEVVPMSGITELFRFGPMYTVPVALVYATLLIWINSRSCISVVGAAPIIVANAVITFFTIQAFSYQLRNSFRQIIYVGISMLIIYWFKSASAKSLRPQNARKRPAHERIRAAKHIP